MSQNVRSFLKLIISYFLAVLLKYFVVFLMIVCVMAIDEKLLEGARINLIMDYLLTLSLWPLSYWLIFKLPKHLYTKFQRNENNI